MILGCTDLWINQFRATLDEEAYFEVGSVVVPPSPHFCGENVQNFMLIWAEFDVKAIIRSPDVRYYIFEMHTFVGHPFRDEFIPSNTLAQTQTHGQ